MKTDKKTISEFIDKITNKDLSFGQIVMDKETKQLLTIYWENEDNEGNKICHFCDDETRWYSDEIKQKCEILGHPLFIGDILKKMYEKKYVFQTTRESNHPIKKIIILWSYCGINKSLQQIIEESEWECFHCAKEGSTWHRNHPKDEQLKDENARNLLELILNLYLK